MIRLSREQAVALRIHAQQLDREPEERAPTDAAIFDLGIQDTGRDGASWALVNRGVPLHSQAELYECPDVALAWTLRGAPHFYRRAEIVEILAATSPYSDTDAAKRLIGAAKPLEEAGIGPREGLGVVARELRAIVDRPRVKGDVSTRLSERLDAPYLRDCRRCDATHTWELPFRYGALYDGLELEPGTSPPVLRRIPGWPRRRAGPAEHPDEAPERLQPIRAYLRFLGPAAPQDVAAHLDGSVADVKAHWPADATQVQVEHKKAWTLGGLEEGDLARELPGDLVRLLGPFDLLLQGRDRSLLVPDRARHKPLWPALGRPGAILVGTDLVGTWRPRATGEKLAIQLDLWDAVRKPVRDRIEEQAERLAGHRGLALSGVKGESS
jgi:hypothetical protein